MRRWLPLGLAAAVLVIGGSACGQKQSQVSAGGWMLAFQGDQNGEWATFAVGLEGGDPVRIDGNERPGDNSLPNLLTASPDGKSLIIPDPSGLVVMRTDGSGERRLAAVQAAWSPDGKRLAFVEAGGGISVSDVNGGHVRRLTHSEDDSGPTWSPDGKRIAFTNGFEEKLFVIDANGENERELVSENASQAHWSPDGRSISYFDWDRGLLTVSAKDGHVLSKAAQFDDECALLGEVAWSPDGRQVAYTRCDSPGGFYIAVMNLDGTGYTRITAKSQEARAPSWSRDGRSIVYVREGELWEVRLEDRKTRRLTTLYPNGVNVLNSAVWIRGPVRSVEATEPKVLARKDGAVLENPQPISDIAASGSLLAVVPPERLYGSLWTLTPPLLLWDPTQGGIERLSLASCRAGTGVVLTRDLVGYGCLGGHACCVGSSVQAFSLDSRKPETYFEGAYGDGVPHQALAGRIAGDDQYLYFAERKLNQHGDVTSRLLWRVGPKGKTVITTGADAGEPAAADGGRVAVERDDGVVSILDTEGRLLGRISPGGGVVDDQPTFDAVPPATVDLEGPDLVVLRGGLLQRYDSRSLELARSRHVPGDAQMGGLAEGITVYVARGGVHVLRLDDGAEAVIPVGAGRIEAADLTTAGLFYAVNTQLVRYGYVQIEKNAPSHIVFIRWENLLRRLR